MTKVMKWRQTKVTRKLRRWKSRQKRRGENGSGIAARNEMNRKRRKRRRKTRCRKRNREKGRGKEERERKRKSDSVKTIKQLVHIFNFLSKQPYK